jgi:CheY-like chemotaxis protein
METTSMHNYQAVNVLLVEDDLVDIMTIQRGFASLKIANPIITAKDGIEALDILKGRNGKERLSKPYIIFLDLNMPRMNGVEFLKVLREDPELKASVVFVLTTSGLDEDRVKAYDANVAGYIIKSEAGKNFMDAIQLIDHYWRIIELPNGKADHEAGS